MPSCASLPERRRRPAYGLLLVATLGLVVALPPRGADAATPVPAELLPGLPIEAEIVAGALHTYRIEVPVGHLVRLELRRFEADVSVEVSDQGGRTLAVADTLVFPPGPRSLLVLGVERRELSLDVRLLPPATSSRYRLELAELRPVEPADAARVAAQGAYLEGERLRSKGLAETLAAARERFAQALAGFRSVGDAAGEADATAGLARVEDALGDKSAALAAYATALTRQRALGRDKAAAYLLSYRSMIEEQRGERQQALATLAEALELARAAGDRRVEGLVLNNLGLVNLMLGNPTEAIAWYDQAMPAHREAGNPRGEATTLVNLGTLHEQQGDAPRALELMHRALVLRRAIGDPRDTAGTLNNIGVIHFNRDEVAAAAESYRQALVAWREAGDRSSEGATLHNLARVHEVSGDYQRALDLHQQALAIFRQTQSRVREANALTTVGRLYSSLGDYRRALALLEQALPIHREVGSRPYQAATLTELANCRLSMGEPTAALPLLEEALPLRRAAGERLGEAATLQAYGRARAALGELRPALETYQQARDIYAGVGHRRGEAATGVKMAAAHLALGETARAGELAAEALARSRELGDRRGEAGARLVLARLAEQRGDPRGVLRELEPAILLLEGLRSRAAVEELRSTFLASVEEYYELQVDALVQLDRAEPGAGHDARALMASESARARALLDALAESGAEIREGVDPELLAREQRLRQTVNAKAARQSSLGAAPAPERALALGREIDALTVELQGVEAAIRVASPRYAALVAPRVLAARDIQQQLLDGNTLLVEVALGTARGHLFAVTRDSMTVHELPGRDVVERAARSFIEASRTIDGAAPGVAAGATTAGDDAAAELARLLLAPLDELSRQRRLLIVPAGALLAVPWAALPLPDGSGRPLLATHEIVLLPSASTLAALRLEAAARPRPSRELVVLADPVFDAADPRVRAARRTASSSSGAAPSLDRGSPGRLLGSRREAAAILALVPPQLARPALDFAASRATALSGELTQYRLVHFATHGVLDDTHPELSGIVLSLVDERGETQDGFLRLHEISALRLAADLVVLSACQTGLGKEVRGEGLLGLNRAFMYAGAARVVSTLWKVDDRATAELMRRFYAEMLGPRRLSPAAALRAAQLSLAAEPRWRSTYYWAGFVLQGEWT